MQLRAPTDMAATARLIVVLFLSACCEFRLASADCNVKFFGPACEYECHCLVWNTCLAEKDCSITEGCVAGLGGTVCQYVNLAYNQDVRTDMSILAGASHLTNIVDGNPAACIAEQGVSGHPVSVNIPSQTLADRITVLLYEAFVKDPEGNFANVNQIETTVYKADGSSKLLDAYLPNANDMLITYRLSPPAKVTRVEVRAVADTSLTLCEISVLAGRNVALRRNATIGEAKEGGSWEATRMAPQVVDGDQSTCSRAIDGASVWHVPLGRSMKIWRIKTYARTHDGGRIGANDTVLPQPEEISDIIVGPSYELCEVEIYGDCPDGFYGWDCNKKCQCENRLEICDSIFGYCPQSGCRRGYTGNCTQECPSGTYGKGCAWNCSAACVDDDCNHETGKCTNGCKPGMDEGSECREDCEPGFYGDDCDLDCSEGCIDGVCDVVTGYCQNGCKQGMTGYFCKSQTGGGEGVKASLLLATAAALSTILQYI